MEVEEAVEEVTLERETAAKRVAQLRRQVSGSLRERGFLRASVVCLCDTPVGCTCQLVPRLLCAGGCCRG